MTQGAIDLVQAELTLPLNPAVPLLQHMPAGSGPKLLFTELVSAKPLQSVAITEYTWWDSKKDVCISFSVGAPVTAGRLLPGQVRCSIEEQRLDCTILLNADSHTMQHKLTVPYLLDAVQPAMSACFLDNQPVPLVSATVKAPDAKQACHVPLSCSEFSSSSNSSSGSSTCSSSTMQQPARQPCSRSSMSCPLPPSSCQPCSAHSLQPLEAQTAITAPAAASRVLIRLRKAQASKVWDRLTQPPPVSQPCKHVPCSAETMALLRRTLIQQRQQRHEQQNICLTAALDHQAYEQADSQRSAASGLSECKPAADNNTQNPQAPLATTTGHNLENSSFNGLQSLHEHCQVQ